MDRRQQGQGGLMVMTPGFHPGDPGSIPLVGDFFKLSYIHILNLVPNCLTAGYYNFQHSVQLLNVDVPIVLVCSVYGLNRLNVIVIKAILLLFLIQYHLLF